MNLTGVFSLPVLFGLLCGVAVGGGVALLVVAIRGLPARPSKRRHDPSELLRFLSRRGSLAIGAGLLVLLVTRWPILGIAAGVLVFAWDRLFGGAAEERAAMRRGEALAAWTEALRDTIAGAVGLGEAIPAAARAGAAALRPHLDALGDRLGSRTPVAAAL